jgi:uncharacterized membrane protein
MARLLALWHWMRAGLWFVPTIFALAAAGLAGVMLTVDFGLSSKVWWLHSGNARDASSLLQTLLSSMITMTTLAVSITMIVLTLAAGQLGPRLIPNFIDDQRTQVPLGFLVATIVYLLLILRTLHDEIADDAVPHVAVTVGTMLVLVSLGLLLFFVHHLSRSIVSDHIIAEVGRDLDRAVRQMLPEPQPEPKPATDAEDSNSRSHDDYAEMIIDRGGYIEAIDHNKLVACACQEDARIELLYRAGHHVLAKSVIARVAPSRAADRVAPVLRDSIVTGAQRTPIQDLEFSIRQLVEIALRALSPGIQDPYTAIAVIDRLGMAFATVILRGPAQQVFKDDNGHERLIVSTERFGDMLDVAFHQIRQASESDPAVLIRAKVTLVRLRQLAQTSEQRRELQRHLDLLLAAARRGIRDPSDLADFIRAGLPLWPTDAPANPAKADQATASPTHGR